MWLKERWRREITLENPRNTRLRQGYQITKITKMVKIKVETIASIFLNPSFMMSRSRKTSRTVTRMATIIGIPKSRLSAMAEPST